MCWILKAVLLGHQNHAFQSIQALAEQTAFISKSNVLLHRRTIAKQGFLPLFLCGGGYTMWANSWFTPHGDVLPLTSIPHRQPQCQILFSVLTLPSNGLLHSAIPCEQLPSAL